MATVEMLGRNDGQKASSWLYTYPKLTPIAPLLGSVAPPIAPAMAEIDPPPTRGFSGALNKVPLFCIAAEDAPAWEVVPLRCRSWVPALGAATATGFCFFHVWRYVEFTLA